MSVETKTVPRSPCVISNLLDLLGDKWTFLVIRDMLFFGKHEFKEFLASPESIATNILSDRLKKLLHNGVIAEMAHPLNRSRKLYYLTQKGKDLLPIMVEMVLWGEKHLPRNDMMESLFRKVKSNRTKFEARVLGALETWEANNLRSNELHF